MGEIEIWMKKLVYLYLLLSAILQLGAKEEYEKYLRYFAGLCIVVFLSAPVCQFFRGEISLEQEITRLQREQEISDWKKESGKIAYLQQEYYKEEYRTKISEELKEQLQKANCAIDHIVTDLGASYEIKKLWIYLKEGEGTEKVEQTMQREYPLKKGVVEIVAWEDWKS